MAGEVMRIRSILLCSTLALFAGACHPGPIIDNGPKPPPADGTIAGMVTTTDPAVAVPGRKVTAVEVDGGARYEATTAANGGYTLKVPAGTYRIDVELAPGEAFAKRPDPTRVNGSDLDPGRDFVITVRPAR
jgi:hypothetical protein